ncbi:MAG: sensor histidine kinase [Candidatus Cryptobacteroides sp.]
MTNSKNSLIIHGFALMHAAVSLACQASGIADDLMLTLLTMFMVVILCLRLKTGTVFILIAAIIVNIVGFLLGMGFAKLFSLMPLERLVVHPLSTLVATEIIGWCTVWTVRLIKPEDSSDSTSAYGLRWLLVAFVIVIICRLAILYINKDTVPKCLFFEILFNYFFTCLAIVGVSEYAIRYRIKAEKAREETELAHYRYLRLKQQVNPHFLFNSLNVLDCMIQEQSTKEASEFTGKLAEIYRYMLRHEDQNLVRLRDELALVEDYVSLLKVRFTEGLVVNFDIPEEALNRSVVPCSLQLLIENATKHNMVGAASPLKVEISVRDDSLTISNNIQPRISDVSSTGLGLKYLRRQYSDICGREIEILSEGGCYTVKLPLV